VLRGTEGIARLELTIRGDAAKTGAAARVPTDLVVMFDRSGSMSGDPIEFARAAVRELVAQLGPEDRFALVSYASEARVDVPLTAIDGASGDAAGLHLEPQAMGGLTCRAGSTSPPGRRHRGPERAPRLVRSRRAARRGRRLARGPDHQLAAPWPGEFVLSAVGVGGG
jgi:Ca-activated chloride channel family protein